MTKLSSKIVQDSSVDIPFDVERWEIALDEQISAYTFLIKIITNPEIASTLFDEKLREMKNPESKAIDAIIPDNKKEELVRLGIILHRSQVFTVYSMQMIVVVITYFEGILKNFVTSLFCKFPQRMFDFIHPASDVNLRGIINLQELLEADSKRALIYTLALKAASNLTQGSIKDIIKRLQKITRNSIDEKLLQAMIPIENLRNQIVHEMSALDSSSVKVEDVDMAFKATEQTLLHFEEIAKKMGISIHRFVVDE